MINKNLLSKERNCLRPRLTKRNQGNGIKTRNRPKNALWPQRSHYFRKTVWRARPPGKSPREPESPKALFSITSKRKKTLRCISSRKKQMTLSSGFIHKQNWKKRRFQKGFSQSSTGSLNTSSLMRISLERFSFEHYNQPRH